jgi:hypothetical protein
VKPRERLFAATNGGDSTSNLISTHVNFLRGRDDRRRRRGELRQLAPEEKMLCALRQVLAQMSTDTGGKARYFVLGSECRLHQRHVSPGAKDGDPGTYRFSGRCRIGVVHASGDTVKKMIDFTVSFRDAEDSMGLPTVEYFDPTTIDELDAATPL